MSKVIKETSSPTKRRVRRSRKANAGKRTSYLRLYGDVVDELNEAVRFRQKEGKTRASIAEAAGIDPATLTRVLSGREGNSLKTIAAVLYGSEHRIKIQAVPCEHLHLWETTPELKKHKVVHVLDFQFSEGSWSLGEGVSTNGLDFNFASQSVDVIPELGREHFSGLNSWQKMIEAD